MEKRIEATISQTIAVQQRLLDQVPLISEIGHRLADVFRDGGSVYVMGNGGSAADAQHMAGELVGRFLMERIPLPCQAFSTDTSVLTSIANDYGIEEVFLKQVEAFVDEGDAVVGITTSGSSPNVVRAVGRARDLGAVTIGLTGGTGGALVGVCDLALVVASDQTPRIQEAHATVIHILCDLVEQLLFASPDDACE